MAVVIMALVPFAAAANAHPIVKVIDLLKDLKAKAIDEGQTEEASFGKFKYWCSTSISELKKVIKQETEDIDKLETSIESLKAEKKTLEKEIGELEDEIGDLQSAADKAKKNDGKRNDAYKAAKKDLKDTIKSIGDAITEMKKAGETDSAMLQENAQNSIRQALAFLSMKTSDEQRAVLVNFVSADPKVMGDEGKHVKKYNFKSDNVIELLKELQLKFEDDLTAADAAETKAANAYALEKSARDNAEAAAEKSKGQKEETLASTKEDLGEAEGDLKNTEEDKKADEGTLDKTTSSCKKRTSEWEERSSIRSNEIEAISQAIKILAKVSGVRTEAPSNPVPPPSPVDFLQLEMDPKTKAVNLLRQTAKAVHSKALERLALEVSTHLTGPFDKVNDMIQKMILRLMAEQTDEDKHKAWCDLEIEKTDKSKSDKNDKIDQLNADIKADTAKVAQIKLDIKDADKMVADITAHMAEATEIRNAGKEENKIAIKDAQDAQTAIEKAVLVLEDFYKSTGKAFIQEPGRVSLPKDPKLWDNSYSGAADPKDAETGVLSILEESAAKFSEMEADTKAQEVEDQKDYDDSMKAHKVEKERRQTESDTKTTEMKRMNAKIESMNKQKKHTSDELDAVLKYEKDLQPACVDGDSTFADRKAARKKEIGALKSALDTLKNAFEDKGGKFLQIRRHA